MMKSASLAFVVLLIAAHVSSDFSELIGQRLSLFCEGDRGWWGYALFASLGLIGLLHTVALIRRRHRGEAVVAGGVLLLLVVVAVTSPYAWYHHLSSLLLCVLLFGQHALLLYRARSRWLVPHLLAPAVLVPLTGFHSYGLWQKCFVLYLVFAVNVRHHGLKESSGQGP